jgi:hypothetical protein
VPRDAQAHLLAFQGERQVERVISDSPRRVATAWLAPDLMIGAQDSSGARQGSAQFHPGTVYWRIGTDEVGWIRLLNVWPANARARANRLDIRGTSEFYFQISAPGLDAGLIQANHWQLPGLECKWRAAPETRIERKPDGRDSLPCGDGQPSHAHS